MRLFETRDLEEPQPPAPSGKRRVGTKNRKRTDFTQKFKIASSFWIKFFLFNIKNDTSAHYPSHLEDGSESVNIKAALFSYMRAFGDGPGAAVAQWLSRRLDQVHEPKSPQEIVHQKRTGIDVLPFKSCTKQKDDLELPVPNCI
ncbi:hypothetical protein TNCV_3430931 [Trichonephila clavipes]|nr:hypothetical protein TNCV_3430931 [Trichonephila clavipes]